MVSDDRQEDLVGGVADALTLDCDVQWDECARRATPVDRKKIQNLQIISRVLRSRPTAGQALQTATTTSPDSTPGTLVRRAVNALIAIATVEVAAALLLLLWSWDGFFSAHGEVSVFLATKLVAFVTGACLLLFAGGRERRSRALGLSFLLMATMASHAIVSAFLLRVPPQQLVPHYLLEGSRLVGYVHIPA